MGSIKTVSELDAYAAFVDDMWFYEPAEHGGMPELGYLGLCIAEEGGEIAGKIKKAYRDLGGTPDDEALKKEMGDQLFYLVKLAAIRGFTLQDIMGMNTEKLMSRMARGKMRGEGDDR